MKAECLDKKTFHLTNNEQSLGKLIYKRPFSYNAAITLVNADHYEIKSAGFFGTSINVIRNEIEIAILKMNWKGQMVVRFQNGQEFIFKHKGTFENKYEIENKEEGKLIQFDPKFNWSKFNYNYDILFYREPQNHLLVLLGIYASNYYMAIM